MFKQVSCIIMESYLNNPVVDVVILVLKILPISQGSNVNGEVFFRYNCSRDALLMVRSVIYTVKYVILFQKLLQTNTFRYSVFECDYKRY